MKLNVRCSRCSHEDKNAEHAIFLVPFSDDSRYTVPCPKGHRNVIILNEQKFEILFDIGAYAILDGYYREAVSSFTSSLERSYEWFIKSVFFEKGAGEIFVKVWPKIASQSERQLGAFVMLYTCEIGSAPLLPSEKNVKFRNEVIHKGKIPTREEAMKYGEDVLNIIRALMRETRARFPKGVEQTIVDHKISSRKPDDPVDLVCSFSIGTTLSLLISGEEHHTRPLHEAIWILQKKREMNIVYY